MAWIDCKKTYDAVPHSRTIKPLDLFGVAKNIKNINTKIPQDFIMLFNALSSVSSHYTKPLINKLINNSHQTNMIK